MFLFVTSVRQYLTLRRVAGVGRTLRRDRLQLRGVDGGMLRRIVPEPGVPYRDPHESDCAEADEDLAPRQEPQQPEHQRGRQAADQVGTREEDALDPAALAARNPAGEGAGDRRPGAGFTGAEQETHDEQDRIAECRPCRGREARPPQHDARQHGVRTLPVGPPCRRNLEQRIRQLKDGEDPAHLDRRQAQIAHDPGGQRRDAGSVQIRDHPKARGQGDDTIARGSGRGHCAGLYVSSAARAHSPFSYITLTPHSGSRRAA